MEWISVKDRLPEMGKPVLTFCGSNGSEYNRVDMLLSIKDFGNGNIKHDWDYSLPTHWMPLPKPPTK